MNSVQSKINKTANTKSYSDSFIKYISEVHVKSLKDVVRRVNESKCDHMFRVTAAKSKSKAKLCHRSSCKPGTKNEKGLPNFLLELIL